MTALILGKFEIDGDDASAAMLRLIDRLAELEASTTDRLAADDDVHILCIDDVVARARDMFEYSSYTAREERVGIIVFGGYCFEGSIHY